MSNRLYPTHDKARSYRHSDVLQLEKVTLVSISAFYLRTFLWPFNGWWAQIRLWIFANMYPTEHDWQHPLQKCCCSIRRLLKQEILSGVTTTFPAIKQNQCLFRYVKSIAQVLLLNINEWKQILRVLHAFALILLYTYIKWLEMLTICSVYISVHE